MFKHAFSSVLFAAIVTTASLAHADDAPVVHTHAKQTTGIVLTSIGGSLLLTAPIIMASGAAYATGNPSSSAAFGPMALGAMAGGAIGLGLLIPGIIMIVTCKPSKERVLPLPETRQPAWSDMRAPATGMRAFTMPLIRGTF